MQMHCNERPLKVYLSFNTHLLEVGEGRITDQERIVKDKAFGWVLRVETRA